MVDVVPVLGSRSPTVKLGVVINYELIPKGLTGQQSFHRLCGNCVFNFSVPEMRCLLYCCPPWDVLLDVACLCGFC